MKIYTQWRHVEAWRESGLSQADYCRQQGFNPKTFSTWARRDLPIVKNAPLEVISVQVTPSAPSAITEASVILLWNGNGVWLCQRRLHQGHFIWPKPGWIGDVYRRYRLPIYRPD